MDTVKGVKNMIDDPMTSSYQAPSKFEVFVQIMVFGFVCLIVMFYFISRS